MFFPAVHKLLLPINFDAISLIFVLELYFVLRCTKSAFEIEVFVFFLAARDFENLIATLL